MFSCRMATMESEPESTCSLGILLIISLPTCGNRTQRPVPCWKTKSIQPGCMPHWLQHSYRVDASVLVYLCGRGRYNVCGRGAISHACVRVHSRVVWCGASLCMCAYPTGVSTTYSV